MENNDNVILDMLYETEKNSTNISTNGSPKLVFKRDEQGILWSYNEVTGEKVGRIYEHGNSDVAKTFGEIIRKAKE